MPADTVPTTYDALLVRCRELEDEIASLKAKPPSPAITPAAARAIAREKLNLPPLPHIAIASPNDTPADRIAVRVLFRADVGGLFEGTVAGWDPEKQLLLIDGGRAGRWRLPIRRVLVLPEGWR